MIDPEIQFFDIPWKPRILRAEKKALNGVVLWAQMYIYDSLEMDYAKKQLEIFIHKQEREKRADG